MAGSKGKYFCPYCILEGLKKGTRVPTSPDKRHQSMLPASRLPETHLSKFLEERLKNSLQREREVRAMTCKLDMDSVTGVDTDKLNIRTILYTKRKTEVKAKFKEQYGPAGFPSSFNYKSKVVLLFQVNQE